MGIPRGYNRIWSSPRLDKLSGKVGPPMDENQALSKLIGIVDWELYNQNILVTGREDHGSCRKFEEECKGVGVYREVPYLRLGIQHRLPLSHVLCIMTKDTK